MTNYESANEVTAEELRAARAGARKAHASNRGIFDFEDLVGDAYIWVTTHPDEVIAWREFTGMKGLNKITRSCHNYCIDVIRKERARVIGDAEKDQYYYTPALVRLILPSIWNADDWTTYSASTDEIRSKGLANEGGDRLALIVDVRSTFYSSSVIDQSVLSALYKDQRTVTEAGVMLNLSDEAVSRAEARAVNRMIQRMGDVHPSKMK